MVTTERQKGDVLTVAAAAEEIGIHHATLYRWAQAGKVAYVIFGGMFFIPYTEVERLKKEKKEQAAQGN
ncbi:hypothetical protein ES703_125925 [subsurface metagenome]